MIKYNYINVIKDDFKLIITLNRPDKRNAFTPTMVNEIYYAFNEANMDKDVKLVIIKANGTVFCAGMDLKTFENPTLDNFNPAIINKDISLGEVFDSLHKPSIALVEGNVIAGGFMILLGCTYVFCKPDIYFRLPELALGIFSFQVMASLLKVMPEKKALQLCLETEYFDVIKAKNLGIVDGYLYDTHIEVLIDSFKNVRTEILQKGIKTLRSLHDIPTQERFSYLKTILDNL